MLGDDAFGHLGVEIFLPLEGVVQGSDGYAGFPRDGLHGGLREAPGLKELFRGVEDIVETFVVGHDVHPN